VGILPIAIMANNRSPRAFGTHWEALEGFHSFRSRTDSKTAQDVRDLQLNPGLRPR